MSRVFNELSQVVVTAEPKDTSNQPYTPVTARYRVDDCNSGNEMVGWTSLMPASSMQIVIPGTVNKIVSDLNRRPPEPKIVTVNTDEGLTTQHYEQYRYNVKNLGFVS